MITNLSERVLRAVNNKVVVLIAKRPETSKGGIIMPGDDIRKYNEGRVVSVGPDVKSCKAGDEIIWEVFKGQAPGHFDETRWVIRDDEVLSVIEPSQAAVTSAG